MTVIKDGSGQGFLAKVNDENRLNTHTVSIQEAAHVSIRNEKTFSIFGETTIVAGTEKTILILINNSSNLIAIDSVLASIQGETGKPVIFRIYIGKKTYTSGGTSKTPLNLNVTSAVTIDVTTVENNPTLGGTDSEAFKIFLESTGAFATDFGGSIVLGRQGSTRITVTGDVAASGTKTGLSRIIFFELDKEVHI